MVQYIKVDHVVQVEIFGKIWLKKSFFPMLIMIKEMGNEHFPSPLSYYHFFQFEFMCVSIWFPILLILIWLHHNQFADSNLKPLIWVKPMLLTINCIYQFNVLLFESPPQWIVCGNNLLRFSVAFTCCSS